MSAWAYRAASCFMLDELEPAVAEQATRTRQDDWEAPIRRYVMQLEEASSAELLENALKLEKRDWTRPAQTRVGAIMLHALGWTKHRQRDGSMTRWVYRRPGREDPTS